jgi:cytochrome c oxidase subunit 4
MNEMPDSEGQATTHPSVGHVVPFRVLAAVWGALLLFTVITVAISDVDLGRFNLEIALAIAIVKASLVLLYFMHMRYDRPMNAIVFITALLFFMLFVSLALLDSHAYAPELIPGYAPALSR